MEIEATRIEFFDSDIDVHWYSQYYTWTVLLAKTLNCVLMKIFAKEILGGFSNIVNVDVKMGKHWKRTWSGQNPDYCSAPQPRASSQVTKSIARGASCLNLLSILFWILKSIRFGLHSPRR